MKNIFWALIIVSLACQDTDRQPPKSDSIQKMTSDTLRPLDNNLVRAEAPDAETHEGQGYALPRESNNEAQSPIDILSLDLNSDQQEAVRITPPAELVAIENLGHTIQLDFAEGNRWQAAGKNFSARQFHFHTPSEHLFDGLTYPMEMHLVSVSVDSDAKSRPSWLVIGLLFKMGKENPFLKEFLAAIPGEEGHKSPLKPGSVNMNDLYAQITKGLPPAYYRYDGSLTTPPFTERVEWIICKQILEASPDQIFAVEKMEGNNARHVQDLHKRKVYLHS